MTKPRAAELPELFVESQAAFAEWLAEHQHASRGVWLRMAKKASGIASVTYAEALEESLRFGWIDGQRRAGDENTFLQKFTPRAARSGWSRINRDKVDALTAAGRMEPRGLAEVERARADGRWDAAYDSASRATVPPDFEAALTAKPGLRDAFAALDKVNRYSMLYRIQTSKRPETRARWIERCIGMLERGERFHG